MTTTHQKSLSQKAMGKIESSLDLFIQTRIKEIHTATIGIIKEFDPEKQTATIQPAIRYIDSSETAKEYTLVDTDHQLLTNVPVHILSGGGWYFTQPVNAGDECLLIFTERSIANWRRSGGVQDQSNRGRRYSMLDAIAIIGLKNLSNPLSSYNNEFPEIRNEDGSIKLEMTSDGAKLTGNLEVVGTITASEDVIAEAGAPQGDVSLINHTHGYIDQTGNPPTPVPSTTEKPNTPATP